MQILKAPAKINLGLEVLCKRDDGYHEINTVFTRVSLSDTITLEKSNKIELECNPNLDILATENICYLAAILFKQAFKIQDGVKIKIDKTIPTGAGLGGGSSNAASVLLGLCKLWKINPDITELNKIASKLGSDVPYFLNSGMATGSGRGEILEYFCLNIPYHILLINPNIHLSTKLAYTSLQRTSTKKPKSDFKKILYENISNPKILQKTIINDFEEFAFKSYPEIATIKKQLYNHDSLFALMSGSGSTVFGLFDSIEKANKAKDYFHNYKTYLCKQIQF